MGLILSLIVIVLKEMFDKRIRTEEDIEKELN
ncbi:capsule biosynthesis protein CapA, partial [Staphylococcus aureus]